MSIWTFRRTVLGVLLAFGLAACGQDGEGFALFDRTSVEEDDDLAVTRQDTALPAAELARGRLALLPPDGFCVDEESLRRDFAVMARCDSLGGEAGAQAAPLGMIVVSVSRTRQAFALDEALSALIGPEVDVLERRDSGPVTLAQIRGATPAGTDPVHWRGMGRIGDHVISMVAFAPKGGSFNQDAGAAALTQLAQRTQDASVVPEDAPELAKANDAPRAGLRGLITGLFD